MFLVREKVSELSARIDWLHDDFTTELNSLVQDFTWQQGTLLDQIEANQGDAAQYLQRSREVQNEQQQVYTLARIENQIVDDLRDRLNELKSGNNDGMLVETHIRYLENLKKRRMRIFVRWMTGPVRSRYGKPSTNYWKSGW